MDKEILIAVVSAVFASSGFWAFMQAWLTHRKSKNDAESMERKALLGILHQELKRECKKYIDRGEIHINEYEELRKYIWEPYKGLGGNGTGEELMDAVTDILKGGH